MEFVGVRGAGGCHVNKYIPPPPAHRLECLVLTATSLLLWTLKLLSNEMVDWGLV